MFNNLILIILLLTCTGNYTYAQSDTVLINTIPSINGKENIIGSEFNSKYDSTFKKINKIRNQYSNIVSTKSKKLEGRLKNRTEKSLKKLAKFENRIQKILLKVKPEVAAKLFSSNQISFSKLYEDYKKNIGLIENARIVHDRKTSEIITQIKFIDEARQQGQDSAISKLGTSKSLLHLNSLQKELSNTEYVQKIIKERKSLLIKESINIIRKNKALSKINKESYYYLQSVKNYKKLFQDPENIEIIVTKMLRKLPEFEKFANEQTPLSRLFASRKPFGLAQGNSTPIISGLPSRAALQQFMQSAAPSLKNVNPTQVVQSSLQEVNGKIDDFRKKIEKGEASTDSEYLKSFKPNSQKTKTFKQRLEYGADIQFDNKGNFMPSTTDMSFKIGYKLNDKSSVGIGINYKVGLGQSWNKINFSSEGIGLRSYVKWKLYKSFYAQGGSEWNYFTRFKNVNELRNANHWQQSALLGINKSYSINKKVNGNFQLLYDFLHNKHTPVSQPFIFRLGYDF